MIEREAHHASVAVVIPYYQRKTALLRRAVESVASQSELTATQVRVIVVDDGSPLPPAGDLAELRLPDHLTIEIVARANGGAGAARNTGIIHALALGCTHLAFLDSDDHWAPSHLSAALSALEDASFYFANSMHDEVPSFSYFKAMKDRRGDGLITGAEAFDLILDECVPHTSQVVYRLAAFADIRFDETMRRTGEDHLFWLTIASRGAALAYSSQIMGHRGSGISIYREALAWDSPTFIPRLLDAFRFRSLVAARFGLTAAQARVNSGHRQRAADEIAFALARRALHSPHTVAREVKQVLRVGPALWRAIAAAIPRLPLIRRRMVNA
ncbi:succinoglycan biosynthesis protein ExoW [Sphingomonas guangdongensis]|uniref:Succinoglycan biosynthesis protein ExoW n=1 Tax=Sphingomonas guangdongensis TaxID=1141890 RepID=A0A285QHY0_9SPHN|nr:glycosyltransferase family A protein [Sphingomonas guangdongensis]SOB81118.1 succinoglycan biosynthesis protein ExoW [Sphingomonas guangdongensis]